MNAVLAMQEAIREGKEVWAVVLRGQSIKMAPGRQVKPGELLCWTHEGAKRWYRAAYVVTEMVNHPHPNYRKATRGNDDD